jgi:hypothetical protein
MNPPKASLDQIFESHIRSLAVTHQPGTLKAYRGAARRFLRYLHHAFPQLRRLACQRARGNGATFGAIGGDQGAAAAEP